MINTQEKVAFYVKALFQEHCNKKLVYHNLWHTSMVLGHTVELANFYRLSEEENFIVQTAAWFHDTGHLFHSMQGHEAVSVELMNNFLTPLNVENAILHKISGCIMATKMPASPSNLTEQILCDADTWHLGTKDFTVINDKVRQELFLREGIDIKNWTRHSINFLKSHNYFTSYCRENLDAGKSKNIALLESQL